ncbi:MAG: hypothetical protein O2820_19475 [Planctomycetota bacterium]|nr:hypothetical protein [Planctomycetota bacterium]MDA1251397.1 hypothetical protein [Planctomycetota bacterium]
MPQCRTQRATSREPATEARISDMVRNQALDWAELFWKNRQMAAE